MRVAVVTQWFSEGLGYAENLLPKALANLGLDVHIISGQGQVYASTPLYDAVYRDVLGDPEFAVGSTETADGIPLHRVPSIYNSPDPHALELALARIQPDVVQTFAILDQWSAVSAGFCRQNAALLFTENHVHASVLPRGVRHAFRGAAVGVANRIRPMARSINGSTQRCFAISHDTAQIAVRRYGVPRVKVVIEPLGVDTDTFFNQISNRDRESIRLALNFDSSDIVCIYTGRLSPDKSPLVLAQAVALLRQDGLNYKGLFVGAGPSDYVAEILACDGSTVLSFRPTRELADLYFAADVGVWPREESTSQLDLMASGRPLVVSSRVQARERLGVGAVYDEGSPVSLAHALKSLSDPGTRERLGEEAAKRIRGTLSWDSIAARRLSHYNGSSTPEPR